VLVTGHTGFKGSWLTAWLLELGAEVTGYSLEEPPTDPSNFELSGLGRHINDIRGDVRDYQRLRETIIRHEPQLIFHLAAQPIVLHAVDHPMPTMDINANGTVNLLEAVRTTDSVRALLCITTDKVYRNQGWVWGYRETDELGGHEPYGVSKAMAELAIEAYRDTFFPPASFQEHGVAIASARAGNVIGGGDFADYRLVPDCVKALAHGEPVEVRNPHSVRPWQHVLEPLSGYLMLGEKLLREGADFSEAWNFGPLEHKGITSQEVVEKLIEFWGEGAWVHNDPGYAKVETGLLRLSWEKAASRMDWRPVYTWEDSLAEIVAWHKALMDNQAMLQVGVGHIGAYVNHARKLKLPWL